MTTGLADKEPHENATLVERIMHYVQTKQPKKAQALATTADYLEECFLWEITFSVAE